ncbi:MAG: phosphodiester glycosidase family protein [Cyanobacteria bacterium P01_A01_bin.105]
MGLGFLADVLQSNLLRNLGLGLLLIGCAAQDLSGRSDDSVDSVMPGLSDSAPVVAASALLFETYAEQSSTVYVVTVPPNYTVGVDVRDTLQTVAAFANETGAEVVLNGGFFDPNNGKTTSYVVISGDAVADPAENERLVGNPNLAPYLEQILNRSAFRRYDCGGTQRYDIVRHNTPAPTGCTLVDAIGAGPQLLPRDTSLEEGFTAMDAQGRLVRDAIGSVQRNARSAVGLRADGTVLLVMVAQQAPTESGMTLAELAAFMQGLGVEQALNLDGGSSASLVVQGEAVYGRLTGEGQAVMRPVKSVLTVIPAD